MVTKEQLKEIIRALLYKYKTFPSVYSLYRHLQSLLKEEDKEKVSYYLVYLIIKELEKEGFLRIEHAGKRAKIVIVEPFEETFEEAMGVLSAKVLGLIVVAFIATLSFVSGLNYFIHFLLGLISGSLLMLIWRG